MTGKTSTMMSQKVFDSALTFPIFYSLTTVQLLRWQLSLIGELFCHFLKVFRLTFITIFICFDNYTRTVSETFSFGIILEMLIKELE